MWISIPSPAVERRAETDHVTTVPTQGSIRPSIQRNPQTLCTRHSAQGPLTWFSPPVETVARGVAAEQSPATWSHRAAHMLQVLISANMLYYYLRKQHILKTSRVLPLRTSLAQENQQDFDDRRGSSPVHIVGNVNHGGVIVVILHSLVDFNVLIDAYREKRLWISIAYQTNRIHLACKHLQRYSEPDRSWLEL
nr:unnamed protein product [Spirometra erinaceieuropaei]